MVHDLCTAVSRIVCDERGLLAALLEMSVRDAAKGPGMLCSVSAQTAAEWAKLSPALYAVYVELSHVLVAKHDQDACWPAIVDVPAAFCFWVIEVHCALILHASAHGLRRGAKCIVCSKSKATAEVVTCGHRYFCAGCLRRWREECGMHHGLLRCPICRAVGRSHSL